MTTKNLIKIKSLKHDGSLHRMWHENIILSQTEDLVIGYNNATKVTEADGKEWKSTEPAIFYFHKKKHYNVIALLKDEGVSFYVNMSSPYRLENQILSYIDYDLDLLLGPEGDMKLLDEDEYDLHKKKYKYPKELQRELEKSVEQVYQLIEKREAPFTKDFVKKWYRKALKKNDY